MAYKCFLPTGKALAVLAANADIVRVGESDWTIVDPFMHEWVRRLNS